MKNIFFVTLFCFSTTLYSQTPLKDADINNMKAFLTEGFTIAEMKDIIENVTYKKHEKWMEKKGYTFREEIPSKTALYYKKNELVDIFVFYYSNKDISEVKFSSSPQKYYKALNELKTNKEYRSITSTQKNNLTDTKNLTLWRSKGYIYYANEVDYYIGIYRDYPIDFEKRIEKKYFPEMIYIKGGSFNMGSDEDDGFTDNKPAHQVTVSNFNIGKFEVKVKEYRHFCYATDRKMVSKPIDGWVEDGPVCQISWNDAIDYCEWLSIITGKKYRLPTEAEWEFAARGGTKSKKFVFSGSDFLEKVGWAIKKSGVDIRRSGSLYPNELDIYDMSSNAWEWCSDWYDADYYNRFKTFTNLSTNNLTGPSSGTKKVNRGGSSSKEEKFSKTTSRSSNYPDAKFANLGFRVVLED